ncbi:hypothetical protein QDS01_18035 [Acinetobacter nosocomialis]|uniref:hypothetical protein n=1 Tax=Acinetobacter nosocomialis TaxID=106654 RepID=UPI00244D6A71|nr:hypothetical protein [Acinetobacter nosocomialis]MDH2636812.1 hypothetical protein [Acinetobacter nosocomialis]
MNQVCKNTGDWVEMCESLMDAAVYQKFGFHEQVFSNQILGLKRLAIAIGNSGNDKTIISHCPFCGTDIATDYDYPAFIQQFGFERAKKILFSSRNLLIDNWYDETTKTFSEHRDKSNPNLINVPAISLAFAATVIKEAGGLENAKEIFKSAPKVAAVMIRTYWNSADYIDNFYSISDGVVYKALDNFRLQQIEDTCHSYEEVIEKIRGKYSVENEATNLSIHKIMKIDLSDLQVALLIWEEENDL